MNTTHQDPTTGNHGQRSSAAQSILEILTVAKEPMNCTEIAERCQPRFTVKQINAAMPYMERDFLVRRVERTETCKVFRWTLRHIQS